MDMRTVNRPVLIWLSAGVSFTLILAAVLIGWL